ncbi:MAG: hypothetical protein SFV55_05555 [Haliscomenobacter sp.]|uniref:hypothetical protein n=1 Tax=Haliscomenobacter sp. TaxID=2717303 RepID=UPI0029A9EE80|nr:hypothetical protein [Haliscomenobacter sp.]MDX2067869.1 hypothetical protein [Haliscomenobacter sp.]
MSPKITLLTTGQPSTNPRLVKEANALFEAGYQVTVVYCYWAKWAQDYDPEIIQVREWRAVLVGGTPERGRLIWWYTRLRHKVSKYLSFISHFRYQSEARAYHEMLSEAKKTQAQLYIAHNLGALPVAARAAQQSRAIFAFDAEDYHRGESITLDAPTKNKIKIEDYFFESAAFVTTASPLISKVYQQHYPTQSFTTINNVFSKKYQKPLPQLPNTSLFVWWFSQTIGLNRGIQDILKAMQLIPDIPIQFTLVGEANSTTIDKLKEMLISERHKLCFQAPVSEIALFEIANQQHIGFALERSTPKNRDICLTNKIFTYLLAGNAIIASDTQAQKSFMADNPGVGWVYPQRDSNQLADILKTCYLNPDLLGSTKRNAWELADQKLNWEEEQKKWLPLVEKVLNSNAV